MQTALLMIDVQESFRHRPYYRDADVPAFIARLQALVDGAVLAGIPVVQVFHVAGLGKLGERREGVAGARFEARAEDARIDPDVLRVVVSLRELHLFG